MSGEGLRVERLTVEFRTPRGLLRAVDDVSIDVPLGTTLGVVGESGSGKSVMARAAMSLLRSNAVVGEQSQIHFQGRDLLHLSPNDALKVLGVEVSMVFQDPMTSLNPVHKVGRQITESLRFHLGLGRREANARAIELLAEVGIPDPARRARQYPHNLSGGMRQRVTIARAISCSPKLLIADEPTTALDVTIQRQILNLLARLQQEQGMTMVLISHDLGVVATRTDQIVVLYGGRVMERAPTKQLFGATRHPYTQALLRSIPRMSSASHTPLQAIPGRPTEVIGVRPGCRFAARCAFAQQRCLEEAPALTPGDHPGHQFACFYPVGSEAGAEAAARNKAAGVSAAGISVEPEALVSTPSEVS